MFAKQKKKNRFLFKTKNTRAKYILLVGALSLSVYLGDIDVIHAIK